MPDDPEELLLPLLVLAPLPERDGAADGAPPPLPPPDGMDGRLTAPPPPPLLRDGGPDAGAGPGAGPGELDGDPSMRPRGPALDRLGPTIGSERGALGTLYERERDSDGSLAGCRSLPIRERGAAAGAGASSVAMRARGALMSGRLLPIRDGGADEPASSWRDRVADEPAVSPMRERGEADWLLEPALGSMTRSDAGIDGAMRVRDAAGSRVGAVRLAAPPVGAVASPPRSEAAMPLEGKFLETARGPVGARNGSALETAMFGAAGVRRATAN